jgi:hypothetical protein
MSDEGQEKKEKGKVKDPEIQTDASPGSSREKEGEAYEQDSFLDVEVGDYVRMTDEALIDPVAQEMTPFQFFKLVGWPNKFMVVDIFIDQKHGQVIRLDPCCGWAQDLEDRSKAACQAHPAKFFKKLPPEQEESRGEDDRYMGVNIAGFDLLSVEYLNGGKEPSLMVKLAGQKPFRVSGSAARALSRFLQARGFF